MFYIPISISMIAQSEIKLLLLLIKYNIDEIAVCYSNQEIAAKITFRNSYWANSL